MLKNGLHSNFPTSKPTQKISLSRKFAEIAKTRGIPASSDMSLNRQKSPFLHSRECKKTSDIAKNCRVENQKLKNGAKKTRS
jgi:hypothetical protein